ncbi:hypothetical protein [Pseudomonas sp. PDM28]|uniref:hypothetical protein n=1 Tax=Pseudomonas sp. PDM28 TaxID=2854770 RepID=UPI00210A995D|nr:hypothetical protein [Pseudomonas sp. PDM28]
MNIAEALPATDVRFGAVSAGRNRQKSAKSNGMDVSIYSDSNQINHSEKPVVNNRSTCPLEVSNTLIVDIPWGFDVQVHDIGRKLLRLSWHDLWQQFARA